MTINNDAIVSPRAANVVGTRAGHTECHDRRTGPLFLSRIRPRPGPSTGPATSTPCAGMPDCPTAGPPSCSPSPAAVRRSTNCGTPGSPIWPRLVFSYRCS